MADDVMTPELVAFVKQQKDRQEIWDCMLRYTRGVDRFDHKLMKSAYHPDAWDDHAVHSASGADFCDWAIGLHTQIQTSHHHHITNHVVEIHGDVAHAETYYIFFGDNVEGPPMLSFGRYVDRLEKRNGEWAIAYRRCLIEKAGLFMEADLPPEAKAQNASTGPNRRDRQDVSYVRPLGRETPNR
jgi:hypothetical protein